MEGTGKVQNIQNNAIKNNKHVYNGKLQKID